MSDGGSHRHDNRSSMGNIQLRRVALTPAAPPGVVIGVVFVVVDVVVEEVDAGVVTSVLVVALVVVVTVADVEIFGKAVVVDVVV